MPILAATHPIHTQARRKRLEPSWAQDSAVEDALMSAAIRAVAASRVRKTLSDLTIPAASSLHSDDVAF
jgi:hypothetical protein